MEDAKVPVSRYSLRAHWVGAIEDYGLKLNNRSGTITWLDLDDDEVENLKGYKCYYPYYKMFVDWNGDVLFCSNDWGREIIIGNLLKQSLYDVWMSDKMKEIRVVPNPYVATNVMEPAVSNQFLNQRRRLLFTNIPAQASIKIFTVSGILVDEIAVNNLPQDGSVHWDMLTREGLEIAAGMYLYHVESLVTGDKKLGKFAVIK